MWYIDAYMTYVSRLLGTARQIVYLRFQRRPVSTDTLHATTQKDIPKHLIPPQEKTNNFLERRSP